MVLEADPGDNFDCFSKSFSEESISILSIYGRVRGVYVVYMWFKYPGLDNILVRDIREKPHFSRYIGRLRRNS